MYLDHDHCERENIRFFAIPPLLAQDLRSTPSRSMAPINRGASHGIQAMGDRSETKIRYACAASGIQKDIWLDRYR